MGQYPHLIYLHKQVRGFAFYKYINLLLRKIMNAGHWRTCGILMNKMRCWIFECRGKVSLTLLSFLTLSTFRRMTCVFDLSMKNEGQQSSLRQATIETKSAKHLLDDILIL